MAHGLAAEDVHVEMRHALGSIGAVVSDEAVAVSVYAGLLGYFLHGSEEAMHHGHGCAGGEIVEGFIIALGDDQHMHGCGRADVVEGKGVLVFVDFIAGDFAAEDSGEDVVAVVGHGVCSCEWIPVFAGMTFLNDFAGFFKGQAGGAGVEGFGVAVAKCADKV